MRKGIQIFVFVFIGILFPCFLIAQSNDIGAIGSLSLSKDIGAKLDVKIEQEFRFNNQLTTFDRSLTSLGMNYTIIRKLLTAELDYDYIQQRQNDYFEMRQRSSIALSVNKEFNALEIQLRTRAQSIWRNENSGDYKFNPKYVWRNKLEGSYAIFGSPIKPFVSAEIFCPINGVNGFYLDGLRVTTGLKYRINVRASITLLVRYDQDIQQANPKAVLYGGIGWNYKL